MIEDEKVVNKLNWVIEEIKRELESEGIKYDDLTPKLEKIIKNCEISISLAREYVDIFYKRVSAT